MKLNQIISESTDPKKPTDLTKYPIKPGNKYPANFYTGKKGTKNGKIVLGYNDVRGESFRTTDPVQSIIQSKSKPDNWLVKTLRGGVPYFYKMYMPVATMKATCGWYLKGKNVSLILQTSDGIPKDYMNLVEYSRNESGELKQEPVADLSMENWAYYDGTIIDLAERPAKPRTSVEAYNYLMYWAYNNNLSGASETDLSNYLATGNKLKKGIREVTVKYPKVKDAVIAKLKEISKTDQFELNLDGDSGVASDEAPAEQQAAPAAAAQAEEPEPNLNQDTDVPEFEPEPDAAQTTSGAAAETIDTDANQPDFGGMPDTRGEKPTKVARPAATDTDDEDDGGDDQSRWEYEALDSLGVEVKDTVDAADEGAALDKIRQLGYNTVTKITDRHKPRSFWDRFSNDRSVKALRKRFWSGNDD